MELTPFVDALPIPRVIKPKERYRDFTYYEVTMREFNHQFHTDLPPTRVWGYDGQLPGPTFEVEKGECVHVKWINDLPEEHFLPIDRTIHSSGEDYPDVRTVVHLHGASVKPESDGLPEAWYTKGYRKTGPKFKTEVHKYPNNQRAATLWYHDHAMGITRLNVYAGLAGMYIIRDDEEKKLNLPSGKYEVPLVIQDRSFNEDGSLFYPANVEDPPPEAPNPSVIPGFAGDFITVNGKVWPFFEVERNKYRFRILNASNQRFYRMSLDSGQPFIQIGSDGGLLEKPVVMDEITCGPAERYDVVIDFSDLEVGTNVILRNTANTPFDFGDPPDPETTGLIMQFRVVESDTPDTSVVPEQLSKIRRIREYEATRIRDITLDVTLDRFNRLKFLLNNEEWIDRIVAKPFLNDVEIWRIINQGIAVHPIHIHLIMFQVLDRIPFDVDAFNNTGQILFTGEPEPPLPNETGWKDTVQAFPGFITRVITRFAPFTGEYVYHCHILEHEDYEMMRPFEVVERKLNSYKNGRCRECSEIFRCTCE